jgi:PAS domain S-box-containing protein
MELRVLIVDDTPLEMRLVVREIERAGYRVTFECVQTTDALRDALARAPWDVIISDYYIGDFSARAALDILRETGLDVPFLIVSATVGEEAAVALLKAGAHDYVPKDRLARLVPALERGIRDGEDRRERRRAEEALRQSEAQYRSLFESAVFGIYRASREGAFLTINPALVSMLGYDSMDELLAVDMPSLFVEPEVGLDFFRRSYEQGQIAGVEALWQRKNGDHIRVRLTGRLTRDPASGEAVFEVIAEDITERTRLQQQLHQAQKMEAVGQLAGGIAHDFNNMLTAILGYADLLTDQIGPDKPIGRDLREIRVAAERAAALTQQLLAFSRKQVIAVTPVNLTALVRNVEPMLRRLLPETIRISCGLGEPLDVVLGDVTQLENLLINLSVNARDAMPRGGTLTIATRNASLDEVFVRTHPGSSAGAFAALVVSDNGTGMSPEVVRRIFEPFFTTKERGRGTGLGLAAVYGTVKQLGGYIDVESEPGRGTTFTSYFPRTEAPATNEKVMVVPVGNKVGAERVLLVEDEGGVRAFARIALARFGYQVVEADSGEAALEQLGTMTPPDLLLTDVVLPGIDGRELARRVTLDHPNARVLYMSGYPTALRTADGFQIPGVEVIEKPFTAQMLLTRVRQVLGSSKAAVGSI